MKKIFGLFFILIGGILIGLGLYVQLSDKEVFNSKDKEVVQSLTRADTKGGTITCNGGLTSTFLQLNDYTKISFSYPDCVNEYKLSYKYKQLYNNDNDVRLDVSISSNEKAKAFLNTKKTYLISLSEDKYYSDFDYSDIKEMKLDNLSYYYFNATYNRVGIVDKSKTIIDNWYVAVPFINSESNEERIITFTFSSQDKVIDSSAIEKMMRSIVIEENKAEYKHSKEEEGYLVGTIKQNKYKSYDHGYILNYKVSNTIPEEETTSTNIGTVVFRLEELDNTKYVSMTLESTSENAKKRAESLEDTYKTSKDENHTNINSSGVKFKKVNNYNLYFFVASYDLLNTDKTKTVGTFYTSYCFVELDDNNYVELYLDYKNIPITEKDIENYLNFTVEEY